MSQPLHRRLEPYLERLAVSDDLLSVGKVVCDATRSLIGASGVNFFPLVPGVVTGSDAVTFHEALAPEDIKRRTLSSFPQTVRDFGHLSRFFPRVPRVLDLNEMLAPRGLLRTQTYNEYWRACHIERQLFVPLGSAERPLGFLCATRSMAERPFAASSFKVLDALRRGLLRQMERVHVADDASQDLLSVLRNLPAACAVFDAQGSVRWLSAAAERELGSSNVTVGRSVLLSPCASELERWSAVARAQLRSEDDLELHGLSARRLRNGALGTAVVVLRLRDGGSAEARADAASRRYRLTRRETEVLAELLVGQANKGIANVCNCSLRTVEIHVSSVLRKVGCSSRAELVARLWSS